MSLRLPITLTSSVHAACAVLAAGLLACAPPQEPPEIRNVLLISMDTTRADRLGCYGFSLDSTPNIDALAREGTLFRHAVSPVPLTLPSHSTLMTGTSPLHHGVRDNDGFRLAEAHTTLAEVLADNGFETGAVVSAFVLDSRFGLAQGFGSYDDDFSQGRRASGFSYVERDASDSGHRALAFLAQNAANPFFLFLHFFDPHSDYRPPGPFGAQFGEESYVGEIAYTDWAIGLVVDKLKELGLYDSTLIVITSDHGESLGDHGELGHGFLIYEATTRVPLIFRIPRVREVAEIGRAVGLVDVMPTILSLLGIEAPGPVEGRNLAPMLFGGPEESGAPIYSESFEGTKIGSNPLHGLVGDRWKYIHGARPELYDLLEDPGQQQNRIAEEAARAAELEARLRARLEGAGPGGGAVPLDDDERERLEALGYLAGSPVDTSAQIDPERPDARDLIGVFVKLLTARALLGGRLYDDAQQVCEEIIAERPETPLAYLYLGQVALAQKRWPAAISHFRLYLALTPDPAATVGADGLQRSGTTPLALGDRSSAHSNLGMAYGGLGDFARATAEFEQALRLKPESAGAHYNLANALLGEGRHADSLGAYRRVLELEPEHVAAAAQIERLEQFLRD